MLTYELDMSNFAKIGNDVPRNECDCWSDDALCAFVTTIMYGGGLTFQLSGDVYIAATGTRVNRAAVASTIVDDTGGHATEGNPKRAGTSPGCGKCSMKTFRDRGVARMRPSVDAGVPSG